MYRSSLNIVSVMILVVSLGAAALVGWWRESEPWAVAVFVVGAIVSASPRIINEWERGVLLRLGRFGRVLSPGLSWVIPGVDRVATLVDMRIRSTPFSAEKTLTKDTVPVDVDAVLFWVVTDAQRSFLEVQEYQPTVSWAAQTTLRDVIGRTDLARMISDREGLDRELQSNIDTKTSEWGITVQSVEIRDVRIPGALEDAMSRQAQADREKSARIILAQSEPLVAEEMAKAAHVYRDEPTAMQLRAMNMTYESMKERGSLMVIPSGLADSFGSATLGLAGLAFRPQAPVKGGDAP